MYSTRIAIIRSHILPVARTTEPSIAIAPTAATESSSSVHVYETILVQIHEGIKVAVVTLNRPSQLNALCAQLTKELGLALVRLDKDPKVHVIILTGNEKAFAAGADIKEMLDSDAIKMQTGGQVGNLDCLQFIEKPIIAAVNGFALGGGCEVVMLCDIVIAGEKAQFGQPEIKIGTLPGAGGTQRLPRAIGKSRAMELILTGNFMDAFEAERRGLVSRVVPIDQVLPTALKIATQIASLSLPLVKRCKAAVNMSYETALTQGHGKERRMFFDTWDLKDRKEGMLAFSTKRKPEWSHS